MNFLSSGRWSLVLLNFLLLITPSCKAYSRAFEIQPKVASRNLFDASCFILLSVNYILLHNIWAFLVALMVKNPPGNAGDARDWFNSWVRKIPWRRKCQPLQHSCLGDPTDRAWRAPVHGIAKRRTQLSTHTHIVTTGPPGTSLS